MASEIIPVATEECFNRTRPVNSSVGVQAELSYDRAARELPDLCMIQAWEIWVFYQHLMETGDASLQAD